MRIRASFHSNSEYEMIRLNIKLHWNYTISKEGLYKKAASQPMQICSTRIRLSDYEIDSLIYEGILLVFPSEVMLIGLSP